jgi:LDH2 family malate/lactate/ureidoglycolate dehydrogenase
MPDVERIWLPGEQSQHKRETNEREGIPIGPALLQQLDQFAQEMGIARLQDT